MFVLLHGDACLLAIRLNNDIVLRVSGVRDLKLLSMIFSAMGENVFITSANTRERGDHILYVENFPLERVVLCGAQTFGIALSSCGGSYSPFSKLASGRQTLRVIP